MSWSATDGRPILNCTTRLLPRATPLGQFCLPVHTPQLNRTVVRATCHYPAVKLAPGTGRHLLAVTFQFDGLRITFALRQSASRSGLPHAQHPVRRPTQHMAVVGREARSDVKRLLAVTRVDAVPAAHQRRVCTMNLVLVHANSQIRYQQSRPGRVEVHAGYAVSAG